MMTLFAIVVASILYWPMEIAYLSTTLSKIYTPVIRAIQGPPAYSRAVTGGLVAYAALWMGLYAFVLQHVRRRSIVETVANAAMYAFAVYGVYNATNLVTFEKWTWKLSLIDMAWGISALSIVSGITAAIVKKYHK